MDLRHYATHPYMPLPGDVLTELGLDSPGSNSRISYCWSTLSDSERDRLWDKFGPQVAIATLNTGREQFMAVAAAAPEARAALVQAVLVDHGEHYRCCGDMPYPPIDETHVITGRLGTVWRDGSVYPKGDD